MESTEPPEAKTLRRLNYELAIILATALALVALTGWALDRHPPGSPPSPAAAP
jgi:hypothetical protein